MAMPRLAGGVVSTMRSSMRTCPELCSSSPAMMRRSVDFPQPDGPTKTTNSPSATSRSTPLMTSTLPKDLRIFSRWSEPMVSSEVDGAALAHGAVGGENHLQRAHLVLFVALKVES